MTKPDVEPNEIYCNSSGGGTWNVWLGEQLYCQVSTRIVAEKHVKTLRQKYVEYRLQGRDVFPWYECPKCETPCDYEGYNQAQDRYEFYCSECNETHLVNSFQWH